MEFICPAEDTKAGGRSCLLILMNEDRLLFHRPELLKSVMYITSVVDVINIHLGCVWP